ncbi:MAG: SurA N-terminal domain-containing protein [Clostridia bacterium]|nr:SurA N-terminal domain-containing protein [Clostridia bacterium]
MKHRTVFLRLSALLVSVLLLGGLVSCGKGDTEYTTKTKVGEVDGRDVYYDELYFLVNGYMDSVKESCGNDPAAMQARLDELFSENVLRTYAILRLCEDRGLTYRERELDDEIDESIQSTISTDFNGDEEAYLASMREYGLTERYLRYQLGTELLYNQLLTVYPEQGLVDATDDDIRDYIEENFIHVYHLVLFDDTGDEIADNVASLESARQQLLKNEKTMYDLIRKGKTEDFNDPAGNGYYLSRGSMDEVYEEAAFSLEIGEVSEVVASYGENNVGEYVPCHYVIQRFELDEAYIDSHLTELQSTYYGSVIAADLEATQEELSFEPNELYRSLDLTDLQEPVEKSYTGVIIACSVAGGTVLLAAILIPVILLKRKHRKKNVAYLEAKQRKGGNTE